MAANTCVTYAGVATGGTDPNFTVTKKTDNDKGCILYLKYTKGTESGITVTINAINPSVHATDQYSFVSLSGTTLSALTMTMTASINVRIPLPKIPAESTIIANVVFGSANQGGAVIATFSEA
jgi:hypothetical protein